MNIAGGDNDANAYLFAVSAVFAQAARNELPDAQDAALQELLNRASADLADDGNLEAEITTALSNAEQLLPTNRWDEADAQLIPDRVMQDLAERLADVGSSAEPPDLNRMLDQDLDTVVNADDNCWLHPNPEQEDADGSGWGDTCEPYWVDSATELMWQNQSPPEQPRAMTWESAVLYCDGLDLAGHDDWRLPNISELRSLVRGCPYTETGGSCPIVDTCPHCGIEESCLTSDCWADGENECQLCPSATECAWESALVGTCYVYEDPPFASRVDTYFSSSESVDTGEAWCVHFLDGMLNQCSLQGEHQVRCVRG
jgi:hypothetical protein